MSFYSISQVMKKISHLIPLIIIIVFFACNKSDRDDDTSTNSSVDYALGQAYVYDIFKVVHQAANSSKGITSLNLLDTTSLFGCDTLIVDTTSNPMSVIIRFNTNCTYNGIQRNGEITALFSNKYDIAGCNITVSFNNYSQGLFSIESGSILYINNGLMNTLPNYTYNVNAVKMVASNGQNITWSGNQTLAITSGETTLPFSDDSYNISGFASGSTLRGNNFSATIAADLTILGNCNWVSSGLVDITPENKGTRILNFGSACDNLANVSLYGIDYEIALP
jgi:hypothetical protein